MGLYKEIAGIFKKKDEEDKDRKEDIKELSKRVDKLEEESNTDYSKEIEDLKEQIDNIDTGNSKDFSKEIDDLTSRIEDLENKKETDYSKKIDKLEKKIKDIDPEIDEKKIKKLIEEVGDIEVQGYKGHKFLSKSEIGLKTGDYTEKPGYSDGEYQDAYENGIKISESVKDAYDDGYAGVVFERGSFPLIYNSVNGKGITEGKPGTKGNAISFRDIHNFTIDFNDSVFYLRYDSDERNPYDKNPGKLEPWELQGNLFGTSNCSFLTIKGATMRGDNYQRSFDNKGEEADIANHAMRFHYGNRFINVFNMDVSGFRCEAVNGGGGVGDSIQKGTRPKWKPGKIGKDGKLEEKSGQYSIIYNLKKEHVENPKAIRLRSLGFNRDAKFTNDKIRFTYIGEDGKIDSDTGYYTTIFHYPKGTQKVAITAHGEGDIKEKDLGKDTFGNMKLGVDPGEGMLIQDCEFHKNMRGGISNVVANTTVRKCKIHTIGKYIHKFGWKSYAGYESTYFGIDQEDLYVDRLTVDDVHMYNTGLGILSNARNVIVTNSQFEKADLDFFGTRGLSISNNILNDSRIRNKVRKNSRRDRKVSINNNTLLRGDIEVDTDPSNNNKFQGVVMGNVIQKGALKLRGNIISMGNSVSYHNKHNFLEYDEIQKADDIVVPVSDSNSPNSVTMNSYSTENRYNTVFNIPKGEELKLFNGGSGNDQKKLKEDMKVYFNDISFIGREGEATLNINQLARSADKDKNITQTQNFNKTYMKNINFYINAGQNSSTLVDRRIVFNSAEFEDFYFTLRNQQQGKKKLKKELKYTFIFNDCTLTFNKIKKIVEYSRFTKGQSKKVKFIFNNCNLFSDEKELNIFNQKDDYVKAEFNNCRSDFEIKKKKYVDNNNPVKIDY